jgi:hypothetical protein
VQVKETNKISFLFPADPEGAFLVLVSAHGHMNQNPRSRLPPFKYWDQLLTFGVFVTGEGI